MFWLISNLKLPQNYKDADVMLGNLDQMEAKISSFRHNEFWMDCALPDY
jgi:hypothetical protein